MKQVHKLRILLLSAICLFAVSLQAQNNSQDSTGLLGDDFSLEGALQLFKKADNLEAFEKDLNNEKNYVNNLDLNEDGEIDYIRIVDQMEDDVHAIVLQVPVSKSESQDIAVIEIEKTGSSTAVLQIVGDEDLYGPQHFVEPVEETTSGGKGGPNPVFETELIVVNVWLWPSVRYIYAPGYRVYVSPWRWAYYPSWWRPWRPHPWRYYHTRRVHYRVGFGITTNHRVVRAHRVYTPVRRTSVTVRTRSVKRTSVARTSTRKAKVTKTAAGNKKAGVAKTTTTTKVATDGKTVKAGRKKTTTKVGTDGKTVKAGQKKTGAKITKKKDGSVKATKKTSKKTVKKKKGKGTKKTKTKKTKTKKKKKG